MTQNGTTSKKMYPMKRLILVIAIFGLTVTAAAADLTVAGFTLGQRVSLSDCKSHSGFDNRKDYDLTQSHACFAQRTELGRAEWVKQVIVLPYTDTPEIVRHNQINAYLKDENLVGLDFVTYGVNLQSLVVRRLTEKYGEPTSLKMDKVQNRMGASFDSVTAKWTNQDLTAIYYGTMSRLDDGWVLIDLPSAAELRAAENELLGKSRKKL